ncbi:hypothetical protein CF319_g2152 [Tilletia indica]|uniref:Uncharacterized protein n=1 Tax=Tilletia indica TaxID=43049 RepID=A0A8T8TA31_9BASI|nr:hypothetical protein CF319_g2152 [Tilletia indica]KAE8257446.1 hypothetical protein A4X13_0g2343 [Tilletia indica]
MASGSFHQYSPAHFDSLPSVEMAEARFNELGGLGKVAASLARVAQEHPASQHIGIQLLHRHCDLDEDEIMLAYGDATIPVKHAKLSAVSRGKVYATSWGLRSGSSEFVPLEFAFVEDDRELPGLDAELAENIARVLRALGLEQVLGLALVENPRSHGVEITHGRANVVMPGNLFAQHPKAFEVLWYLPTLGQPVQAGRNCLRSCLSNEYGMHQRTHKKLR